MALDGKYALITGSSRGIGRGIALALAQERANVAVHYYENEAAAKDTLERVRKHGADGFIVQADVSRVDDVRRMFAEVKQRFGTLDVFVANARPEAAKFYQKPMDITLEAWDHAMDSQAKAFLVGVRESAELMGQGGRVIATGTPEGVGAALGKFLKKGDKIEAEVERIGVLANRVGGPEMAPHTPQRS